MLVAPRINPRAELVTTLLNLGTNARGILLIDLTRLITVRWPLPPIDVYHVELRGGEQVIYTQRVADNVNVTWEVHRLDLRTRQNSVIHRGANRLVAGWDMSPDGRYLTIHNFQVGEITLYDMQRLEAHATLLFPIPDEFNLLFLRYFSPPTWSPDSTKLAVAAFDKLYIFTPDGENIATFEIPGETSFQAVWSHYGRRLLVRPLSVENQPIRIVNLDTGAFEPVSVHLSGANAQWWCDGRWLTYRTYRDSVRVRRTLTPTRPQDTLIDLQTSETILLNDLPTFGGHDVVLLTILDCVHGLVQTVGDAERALYLFDLTTHTAQQIAQGVLIAGWLEQENALVYWDPNVQPETLYKHAMRFDAEPVKLGERSILASNEVYLADYTRYLALFARIRGGTAGRLALFDLRSGSHIILTRDGDWVAQFALWDDISPPDLAP